MSNNSADDAVSLRNRPAKSAFKTV